MELNTARTDRGGKIKRVFRGEKQNQMRGRLLQCLEQGVGDLVAGPVELVYQEHAPAAAHREQLRPLAHQPHLRDRNLPQRTFGAERDEIGMRVEKERILSALIACPALPLRDERPVFFAAEVVL